MNLWPIRFFRRIVIAILILIVISFIALARQPQQSCFALRYGIVKIDGKIHTQAYLDCFDITKDKLVKSVLVNPNYNSITVLDDQRIIFCNTAAEVGSGAEIYNWKKGKIVESLKLSGGRPSMSILLNDKIVILSFKTRHVNQGTVQKPDFRVVSWPILEFFDRETLKKLGEVIIRDHANILEELAYQANREQLFFLSWSGLNSFEGSGLIGSVDSKTIKKTFQIDYGSYFGGGRGIAMGKERLYITAVDKTPYENNKPEDQQQLNKYLFVFDPQDLSLIKKIPISILAEQLTYVRKVNKLYIAHSSWDERTPQYIEVLDCETDKIIKKIPLKGFRRMSYVGKGKLYVSHSGGPLFGSDGSGGIAVIDVKADKIIKNIPGEYAPISYNFEPVD